MQISYPVAAQATTMEATEPGQLFRPLHRNRDARSLCLRVLLTNPDRAGFVSLDGDQPFSVWHVREENIGVLATPTLTDLTVRFDAGQPSPDRNVIPGDLLLTEEGFFAVVERRGPAGANAWLRLSLRDWSVTAGLPDRFEHFASWSLISAEGTRHQAEVWRKGEGIGAA